MWVGWFSRGKMGDDRLSPFSTGGRPAIGRLFPITPFDSK
jgi:hypothetical protein